MDDMGADHTEIERRVRLLFKQKLIELDSLIPATTCEQMIAIMDVFWQVVATYPSTYVQDIALAKALLPPTLSIISPDYSDARVRAVVDVLIREAHMRRINLRK